MKSKKTCGDSGGINRDGTPCKVGKKSLDKDGRCKRHPLANEMWPGIEHPKKRAFLEHFRRTGNQSRSAKAALITSTQVGNWKERDPLFLEYFNVAKQMSADELEATARRLATGKVKQYKFAPSGAPLRHPVTGEPYYEEVFDTGMLKFLHKIVRPEAHREQIDIRMLGINLTDLPDEALERLAAGEDLFAVIGDLLRKLKTLEGSVPQEVLQAEVVEDEPKALPPGEEG